MTGWQTIDELLGRLGIRFGAPIRGQTTGGTHEPGSLHYLGLARDYGRANSDTAAITAALVPYATGPGAAIAELFDSTAGVFLKNGAPFQPSDELRREHYDHVHVGLASAVDLADATPTSASHAGTVAAGVGAFGLRLVFVAAGVALLGVGAWRSTHPAGRP